MDPAIKSRLLGNMAVGDAITSGILPRIGAPTTTPGYGTTSGIPGDYGFGTATPIAETGYVAGDGTPYQAPTTFTAGFTPDQTAAFDRIRAASGLTPEQLGSGTYSALTGFNAPTVSAGSVTAPTVGPTSMTAARVASVDPMSAAQIGSVDNVTSKNFTDYDFNRYANPYLSNVVDPVEAYFAEEGNRAAAAAKSAGRAAGALRGSSPMLAEALSRGEVSRQAGMALSPLYQDAFKTSAGLITTDANRNLSASQGNQAAQLARATAQAQLEQEAARRAHEAEVQKAIQDAAFAQQAGVVNQDSTLRTGLANQEAALRAGIANQGANLQAGIANQGAATAGAQIQAAGAAGLANANKSAFDSANIVTQNLMSAGNQQQAMEQAKIDDIIKALNIRNSLVTGAVPGASGQITTQTGGGGGLPGVLGALGTLGSGLGALGVTI